MDLGRDHGIGFLRDPRRMNVALTRSKKSLIILAPASLGRHNDPRCGQDYFYHFRDVCWKLGVTWAIPAQAEANEYARSILQQMQVSTPKSRTFVTDSFRSEASILRLSLQPSHASRRQLHRSTRSRSGWKLRTVSLEWKLPSWFSSDSVRESTSFPLRM